MWELDYKESWAPKNWCFWTAVLEKTLESPLDCKEIQLIHPKGDQSWIFIGRTDAEAETPILWSPDVKNWLIGRDPDAGKDWGQEKGMTEDKMVGWHHQLNGQEFEQALGVGDGQGSLVCCSLWGRKESDTTEQLNNNKQITIGKSYRVTSPIENRLMEKPALCKLKIVSWQEDCTPQCLLRQRLGCRPAPTKRYAFIFFIT